MDYGKCLRIIERGPPRIGEDYAIMEYGKSKSLIDVSFLFDDFFGEKYFGYGDGRDSFYPSSIRNRKIISGENIQYRFEMHEFAEAFFGKFSPKEIVDFLSPLFENGEDNEEFLDDLLKFEKRNYIAFPIRQNNRYRFFPLNFDVKELNDCIINVFPKSKKLSKKKIEFWYLPRIDIEHKDDIHDKDFSIPLPDVRAFSPHLNKLRLEMLKKMPRIILPITSFGRIGKLDIWELIKEYPIDVSNLEVMRKV